jgi:biotin carboxyl carrier protein
MKGDTTMKTAMFVTGLILVSTLASGAATTGTINACQATADAVERSCKAAAQSDYYLALGKCENITNPAERKACQQQAAADLKEALRTCDDQHDVREAACARLGPAPYDPVIKPNNFVATIDNPYFPLKPGTTFIYEGQTGHGLEHSEFAVTHNTRVILGVTCVEVRDSVFTDGMLTEDTLDWFAQDKDGNVWYFGENTHELEDGLITTIDGTFMAGVNGDKPGIIMKAHPAVGDFYRQEFSLANAEDFAETLSVHETVTVRAGTFHNCLRSQETTPLETDLLEHKLYAPGVGNVLTIDVNTGDRVELIQIISK